MITSFYSYKGGVGRSQLVANLAAYFCYYQNKKVLLIDWDLEAPGLHFYFNKKYQDINKQGLINLFQDYVDNRRKGTVFETAEQLPKFTESYIFRLSNSENQKGYIDLIPAGDYSNFATYKSSCIDFDWYEFYETYDGKRYIEYVKRELKKLSYDFIFIDSRTGLNDYSNICNIQMPDVNVAVVAPTQQNIEGCSEVIKQIIKSPYIESKLYREGIVIPIYSRVQFDSDPIRNENTVVRFEEAFGEAIKNNLLPYLSLRQHKDITTRNFIQKTIISYEPSISLWENIVFQKNTDTLLSPIAKKYIEISDIFLDVYKYLYTKEVKKTNATEINLYHLLLNELPKELTNLSHIEALDLSNNNIVNISIFKELVRLKKLNCNGNEISDISVLQNLVYLEHLSFSENKISDISCLQNLVHLSHLDFSFNQISDISYLQGLSNLTSLDFSSNQVSDISYLQELSNLTSLDFSFNQVSDISCLKKLNNLTSLDFSSNQVSDISCLQEISNLKELYFRETPAFLSLPKELQDKCPNNNDNQIGLLQYWLENFANKNKRIRCFREAKVVFVGDGDIGKTSLIQVLLGQPLTERGRTHQIEITTNKTLFSYKNESITAHFWDFGGQEIMHATHKFFMTERSVYVLVVNGRKDNDDHKKWLEQLKITCGDSPIILVANKMDKLEDKQQLPIHTLKDQYPQIRCVIETSCNTTETKTTRGIDNLQAEIQAALQTLRHFEEPFAAKYFAVKEKLQTTNKNYIDYRQYAQICEEVAKELSQDFNEGSQSILAEVLNYLGIMLNFRKQDESLENLYVFKPEWIINGVYKIINSQAIQNSKGKITETEIFRLLKEEGYQKQQEKDFIINMMKHFELAFPKPSFNEIYYLVPSVFALDKPQALTDYWASKKPVLHFRFNYGMWHNNIISYFLVQQHEKIKNSTLSNSTLATVEDLDNRTMADLSLRLSRSSTVANVTTNNVTTIEYFWRNGAILCYANNEVLIEANRYEKTISLQVFGEKDKRYALWQVREALDKVHSKFFDKAKLEITEFVIYEHEGKQYPISHEELLRYKAKNRMYWISEIVETDVELDANELLGEIDLSDKEKVANELGKLQLAKNQVDKLVEATENTNAVEFFELLDSFGIKGFHKSSLRDEFISGVYKTDANYWQKLLVFVKSLGGK
jgi:small GTP-binding protein